MTRAKLLEMVAAFLRGKQGDRSNAEMADMIGVSEQHYNLWVSQTRLPGLHMLRAIASGLGMPYARMCCEMFGIPYSDGRQTGTFACTLLAWLEKNDVSNAEFARECCVTRAAVSFWVNNRSEPRPEQLWGIADAMGVSVLDLFRCWEFSK